MSTEAIGRNYSLVGPESQRAVAEGRANGDWFLPFVEPAVMRTLMIRSNGRAAADVALWLALLIGSGVWAFVAWGTWWAVPAFAIYGAFYGGAADARWHECGHGSAFRAQRANDVVYYFASFAMFREPTVWRWSHVRHHSDTIIVGRDPEIVFPRPPAFAKLLPNVLNLLGGPAMLRRIARHARGTLSREVADYVPPSEHRKVVWEARAFLAIHLGILAWSLIAWSILPLLYVTLATFYGVWLAMFFGLTQHAGLREDVLDHRLNTRTVYMNPVFRFLYLNMNYHVEHHMFPSVPYRNLPGLHVAVKDQLLPAKPSTLAAYREIVYALRRLKRDQFFELPLPELPMAPPQAQRGNAMTRAGVSAWGVEAIRATPKSSPTATAESAPDHGPDAVDLGPAAELALGELRRVDFGDQTFLLCRPEKDFIALTDGLCTHGNAHLADGLLDGCFVECPKHNGRFDVRTGEPTRRPVQIPLPRHRVTVVDGRIIAHLPNGQPTSRRR
jgi:Na+-transporting NADH:ubiquinone oxidoreductase subunit F